MLPGCDWIYFEAACPWKLYFKNWFCWLCVKYFTSIRKKREMINPGTCPEIATTEPTPLWMAPNETKSRSHSDVQDVSSLISAFDPQNKIPLCIRQCLVPGFNSLWSPGPLLGFLFRWVVNRPGRTALGCSAVTKRGSKSETRRNPQTKGGGGCFYQLLCHRPTVSNLYLSVLVQNWHTHWKVSHPAGVQEGPQCSVTDWLLCVTANSNSQLDDSKYF